MNSPITSITKCSLFVDMNHRYLGQVFRTKSFTAIASFQGIASLEWNREECCLIVDFEDLQFFNWIKEKINLEWLAFEVGCIGWLLGFRIDHWMAGMIEEACSSSFRFWYLGLHEHMNIYPHSYKYRTCRNVCISLFWIWNRVCFN